MEHLIDLSSTLAQKTEDTKQLPTTSNQEPFPNATTCSNVTKTRTQNRSNTHRRSGTRLECTDDIMDEGLSKKKDDPSKIACSTTPGT